MKQAETPLVSNLRRPPPFKGHRGWLWDSEYWFWVKPGPTGNVSPLTVEARAVRRARVPGPGVPAKRITFPMRPSDGVGPDQEPHGGCGYTALICPRAIRTWSNGAEVDVFAKGGTGPRGFVKVLVTLPRGVPTLHYSVAKTPIGARREGAPGRSRGRATADGRPLRTEGAVLAVPLQEALHRSVERKTLLGTFTAALGGS